LYFHVLINQAKNFFQAVKAGNLDEVVQLLGAGVNINAKDKEVNIFIFFV
jgi:hypothetical protein